MSTLPRTGVTSYNGVDFAVETKTHVSIRPIEDRAKRVTTALEYVFDVSTYVLAADGGDTSAEMTVNIRRALTHKGGRLRFENWGFGDLDINNPAGTVRDITYGPHPLHLDLHHMGPNNAWLVKWQCKTTIPDQCANASYSSERPVMYNFSVGTTIDEHGFTVRTITGIVEIPVGQLVGVANVPAAAERLWPRIYDQIKIPDGFKRRTSRDLDESKRQMSFTIVDFEEPRDAFLPGITSWSGSQECANAIEKSGVQFINNISAQYRVARGTSKTRALQHFLALVKSRTDKSIEKSEKGAGIMPLTFRVGDRLHNDEIGFSFAYVFTVKNEMDALRRGGWLTAAEAGGMFLPVPNAQWFAWNRSLADTATHALGNAKFLFDPRSDAIISLCSPTRVPNNEVAVANKRPGHVEVGGAEAADGGYGYYESWIEYTGMSGAIFHKPLGDPDPVKVQTTESNNGYQFPFANGQVLKDFKQYIGAADCYITLIGRAIRADTPVTPPVLVAIGSEPVELIKPWFRERKLARFGRDYYAAQWKLVYMLAKTPGGFLPVPTNPLIDAPAVGAIKQPELVNIKG